VPGVTVLIYDQTCAAEKRRRRKRGLHPDPAERIVINEAVCEGCGDCGVQSNCVAIAPVETPLGRKRQIDQSACNKDFSCVRGFCPSFVTVSGGALKKPTQKGFVAPSMPEPVLPPIDTPYAMMVTGVGGTGVVTIAALIGMAAHLDGLGCGIIDMAGLAQKGGSVVSHVKLAAKPEDITATRIAPGTADLLIGGDLIVSASTPTLAGLKSGAARAVINTYEMMPSDFTSIRDLTLPTDDMHSRLLSTANPDAVHFMNATSYARQWLGDSIGSNLFLLGATWQLGYLPLSFAAIEEAIELNNVAVELNKQAFALGRLWVHDRVKLAPAREVTVKPAASDKKAETLESLVARHQEYLTQYQSRRYAQRFERILSPLFALDKSQDQALSRTAANGLFKLMAYKDEYEVARLYTDGNFMRSVANQFEGDYAVHVHLAPPGFSKVSDSTGRALKKKYGPWIFKAMRLLAGMKGLRGTPFDVFGYSAERRMERSLIASYTRHIDAVTTTLAKRPDAIDTAIELLAVPQAIRGFGPVKTISVDKAQHSSAQLLAELQAADATSRTDGQAA